VTTVTIGERDTRTCRTTLTVNCDSTTCNECPLHHDSDDSGSVCVLTQVRLGNNTIDKLVHLSTAIGTMLYTESDSE
jgi:hypothetical protein